MHKHFQKWLIRTLAATVLCGAATVTKAQYNYPSVPSQSGYGPAIDPAASQPFAQASTTENYTAFSPAPDNSDLAKRLADVEKALKKMDDKAKADKAAAAQVPSVKVGGRVQWDTDTFNQNAPSSAVCTWGLTAPCSIS